MKKLAMIVFVCAFGILSSCKKNTGDSTDATMNDTTMVDTTSMATDTTATPTTPMDNPEPGVEKSSGNEQVP